MSAMEVEVERMAAEIVDRDFTKNWFLFMSLFMDDDD